MIKPILKILVPFLFIEEKFMFWIQLGHRVKNWKYLSEAIRIFVIYRYHCDISPHAVIDKTVRFPHPIGIVIGRKCQIHKNSVIFQNVTLGVNIEDGKEHYPIVEQDCRIYPNSIVMGGTTVHKGTFIGAGSVITKDTVEYGIYHGNRAQYVRTRQSS